MSHLIATLRRRQAQAAATGLLLASLGTAAIAMAVAGPGGTAEQGRRVVSAAPTPGAVAATLELSAARLDAVDAAAGTVTLRGQAVPLHPQTLRVLSAQGHNLGGVRALRPGMQLRFALEPVAMAVAGAPALSAATAASAAAVAPARRIVLIYVD